MKISIIFVFLVAAILFAQSAVIPLPFPIVPPVIYAPTLGKLAIPAAIAGGYVATGVVGGLAGALAVKGVAAAGGAAVGAALAGGYGKDKDKGHDHWGYSGGYEGYDQSSYSNADQW